MGQLVTWLVSLLIGLTKLATTELEGMLRLLTILCSLWIIYWVTVHVVDTHRLTRLPNVLSGHLRCMSVHLGRVKHNSVSFRTDLSKVFALWMSTDELCYGKMTIMLGLTCSSLTEYPWWHSSIQEWTSCGLWCCMPGLTSIMFWSVEKYFCTPCHHSVCKPLLWSCLIEPEWHYFWTIASKFQWSRTRWITSSCGFAMVLCLRRCPQYRHF